MGLSHAKESLPVDETCKSASHLVHPGRPLGRSRRVLGPWWALASPPCPWTPYKAEPDPFLPQLCVILEPMQELMSRHKTYSLSPRDCLKTCLFQKWQRMVAPPGEGPAGFPIYVGGVPEHWLCLEPRVGGLSPCLPRYHSQPCHRVPGEESLALPARWCWAGWEGEQWSRWRPGAVTRRVPPAEPARQQPSKRRKRKMSGGSTMSSGGGNTNNSNSKKKSPASTFALSSQVPVSIPFPFSLPSWPRCSPLPPARGGTGPGRLAASLVGRDGLSLQG